LNKPTLFVDDNKQQLDGLLDDMIKPFDLPGKFRTFGFVDDKRYRLSKGNDIATLRDGSDITLIANGIMVAAAQMLE